jgi:endothelin-converting enzyme/putative endopeptidase
MLAAAAAFSQNSSSLSQPVLDVSAMDSTVDPCADFYAYSCGGWMKKNPIPPDQSSWSTYGKLQDENLAQLRAILEEAAKAGKGSVTPVMQKIGDYFASCMDEHAVENLGAAPLKPYLDRVAAIKTRRDLAAALGALHRDTGDPEMFFGFSSGQDYSDSTQVIAFASAGGLSLPDRDYYLKEDDRSQEIRDRFVVHVQQMFTIAGDAPEVAQAEAATVMAMETALAKASLTRVERRDPYKLFNKMDRKALAALVPEFDWSAYFGAVGFTRATSYNVTEPAFMKEFAARLRESSLDDIRVYLRWHVIHTFATALSSAFVNENFDFFGKALHGVPQLKPRWKRCVAQVDAQLGEALGKEFVARSFPPEMKKKTLKMTLQVEQAMARDIRALDWMSEPTRKRALEKLHTVVNKIGYPDKWRDYSAVRIARDDYLGNVVRAQQFETRRDLGKIGKPVDRGEWFMTPPSVNAYYDQQLNDVNFAAGVLQPPLYDPKMDDAPNYGNTGGTIGHELTHGFDDEGRKYDSKGNLKDWWSEADGKAFEERAQCIRDQYSKYVIVDDVKINGELTSGEDIADLGGLILAWMAWKEETKGKMLANRDDLTPGQRFFVGYAQWACESQRPETLRVRAITDPHSPGRYRVNGIMVNIPEFQAAFACKAGQPMVPEKRCRVW